MLTSLITRQSFFKRLLASKNKAYCRGSGDHKVFTHEHPFVTPQLLRCSFSTTVTSYNTMHPLDDSTVESFFIPGAKVFDRYFECPLGN